MPLHSSAKATGWPVDSPQANAAHWKGPTSGRQDPDREASLCSVTDFEQCLGNVVLL